MQSIELTTAITSEKGLIERIRRGDEKAASLLWDHYAKRVDWLVRREIENDDWQDVAMKVKGAILINIRDGHFQASEGTLNAYILGIARNQIKKYWRDRRPENIDIKDVPQYLLQTTNEFELERKERLEIIKKVMKDLPETHREIFYLKYFKDLKTAEISKRTNLPAQKVSEKTHYALKLVRNRLVELGIFQDFVD